MKKIFLIPFLLLFFIVTSGQSEQHFKTQKRLICKYKWTHNEKYFQQFVENWKNEVPEIPDSVVANWSCISQNSYQVFQAIFDSTRYLTSKLPYYNYSCKSDGIPYLKDTSCLIIPYEMSYDMLEIKMDSFNQDSVWSYLDKKRGYEHKLTFFKPHIDNRKTLYLTEEYKFFLINRPIIFKKTNFYDYKYFREITAKVKIIKKNHRKKIRGHGYRRILALKNNYFGSIPANVNITFNNTFTYAFIQNQNDRSLLVAHKKEDKWYIIYFEKNNSIISRYNFFE